MMGCFSNHLNHMIDPLVWLVSNACFLIRMRGQTARRRERLEHLRALYPEVHDQCRRSATPHWARRSHRMIVLLLLMVMEEPEEEEQEMIMITMIPKSL